jgi:hypothetical protein
VLDSLIPEATLRPPPGGTASDASEHATRTAVAAPWAVEDEELRDTGSSRDGAIPSGEGGGDAIAAEWEAFPAREAFRAEQERNW